MLILLTGDLQAQVIKKVEFSAAEGYTNGWLYGQPGKDGLNVWTDISDNPGNSWTNADGSTFYCQIQTNMTDSTGAVVGLISANPDIYEGPMYPSDPDNPSYAVDTMIWYMPIPNQTSGQITVTWDWRFIATNVIPDNYDPTNNAYDPGTNAVPGTNANGAVYPAYYKLASPDVQLDLSDVGLLDPSTGLVPGASTSHLASQCGMVDICRIRPPSGWGSDGATGPYCGDGEWIHMKQMVDIDAGTFDAWAQRDGEEVWWLSQTDSYPTGGLPLRNPLYTGLNMVALANNDGDVSDQILFAHIRVVGPNPVSAPTLSIKRSGTNVMATFTGFLEGADQPQGPWTTVAVTTPPYTTPTNYTVLPQGKKFYRASM